MKIAGQRSERGVVGEPLKQLADIGDPERPLEARANLAQTFGKSQKWLLNLSRKFVLCRNSRDANHFNPAASGRRQW